jgi:N-methylhydantoinase B/oxoprolinase/acetone carboxylase alpha subunit
MVAPLAGEPRTHNRVSLDQARRNAMTDKTLKTGDKVSWKSHGGTAHGKVVKKQTTPTKIKSHEVKASKDNPQYIVETNDGMKAAHKAGALKKD